MEHRKRRSRIEEAYVQAGAENLTMPRPVPPEYQEQMNKGFDSMMRVVSKERRLAGKVLNSHPDLRSFARYHKSLVRLTPELADRMREVLMDVIGQANGLSDEDGLRVNVWVYMCLSTGESRRILAEDAKQSKMRGKGKAIG